MDGTRIQLALHDRPKLAGMRVVLAPSVVLLLPMLRNASRCPSFAGPHLCSQIISVPFIGPYLKMQQKRLQLVLDIRANSKTPTSVV